MNSSLSLKRSSIFEEYARQTGHLPSLNRTAQDLHSWALHFAQLWRVDSGVVS